MLYQGPSTQVKKRRKEREREREGVRWKGRTGKGTEGPTNVHKGKGGNRPHNLLCEDAHAVAVARHAAAEVGDVQVTPRLVQRSLTCWRAP